MKPLLIIEHAPGRAYGFLSCIRQHSSPVEPVIWKCYETDSCPTSDFAGLIIAGGPMMVSDLVAKKYSFFAAEQEVIRQACARDIPTLGVCLGAEILCDMFGGRVEPGDWVVGWHNVTLVHSGIYDPLFGDVEERFQTFQFHRDHLSVLPPDAVTLATSDTTKTEAFRLPGSTWACLFHPEMEVTQVQDLHDGTPEGFGRFIRERRDLAPYDDGRSSRHGLLGNFFRIVSGS